MRTGVVSGQSRMTVRGQKNWLLGSISRMRSGIQVVEMCSFVLKWSPLDQEASWRPPFGGFKGHVQIRGLVLDWLHWPSNATGFLRKSWETWRGGFQGCLVYRATIMCHVFCLENSLSILKDSQEAESITPLHFSNIVYHLNHHFIDRSHSVVCKRLLFQFMFS